MAALKKTAFAGTVSWLGTVPSDQDSIRSVAREFLDLTFEGVPGERHAGLTRPSCSRVLNQYPTRGTEIRNTRQISVLSAEEIDEIARAIGLKGLQPEWLGATVVLSGLPDLTHLPPSSRLLSEAGVCLIVDMENRPCNLPAKEIEAEHPGAGKAFKTAASGKRGVTVSVERPGRLALGDVLTLYVPDQRLWAHHEAVR